MKANHNTVTKGETEQVRSTESQALCSSLKGHSQSHVGPATALARQTLMRNPHTDWPLSGPNESPILVQEREVSLVHTMCAQSFKPHQLQRLWFIQTVTHSPEPQGTTPVNILKCFSGSFWSLTWGHWPIEQHHRVPTWASENTDRAPEAQRQHHCHGRGLLENTTALEGTGTQARWGCRDKTRASEQ